MIIYYFINIFNFIVNKVFTCITKLFVYFNISFFDNKKLDNYYIQNSNRFVTSTEKQNAHTAILFSQSLGHLDLNSRRRKINVNKNNFTNDYNQHILQVQKNDYHDLDDYTTFQNNDIYTSSNSLTTPNSPTEITKRNFVTIQI